MMTLTDVSTIMSGLNNIAHAGERQSNRIKNILKLMAMQVHEHDNMMNVPEYIENYKSFLGQDGMDTAQNIRDLIANCLEKFIASGILTKEELDSLIQV